MVLRTEREDALLGAAFLLVAARAAEGSIEAVFVQRLFQRFGLHHMRMHRRARGERIDAARDAIFIDVNEKIEIEAARRFIAERDHLAEFPGRIDVEHRERQRRGVKRL